MRVVEKFKMALLLAGLACCSADAQINNPLTYPATMVDSIRGIYQQLYEDSLLDKKVERLHYLQKHYPDSANIAIYFEMCRENIAEASFNADKFAMGMDFALQEKSNSFKGRSYEGLSAILLAKKQYSLAVKLLTDAVEKSRLDKTGQVDIITYAANLANGLFHVGEYKKGWVYARAAYGSIRRKWDPKVTESYALLASVNGEYALAFPIMDSLLEVKAASEELKIEIPKAFAATHPKGASYEAYYQSKMAAFNKRLAAELAAKMKNAPSPLFYAVDADGNKLSLETLKGKVLILDFWATWCHPCISSFSAMRLAVDKFRKDTNVVFLFVDTKEVKQFDKEYIRQKYFTSHHYDFRLVMDDKVNGTYPVAKAFGIVGLPTKFVIDQDGQVRFKISGFEGSDEAAAAELEMMIKMCKESAIHS